MTRFYVLPIVLCALLFHPPTADAAAKCKWRIKGKVVDKTTGQPIKMHQVIIRMRPAGTSKWDDKNWKGMKTDKKGRFNATGHVAGKCSKKMDIHVRIQKRQDDREATRKLITIEGRSGRKTVNLGTLRVKLSKPKSAGSTKTGQPLFATCPSRESKAVSKACGGGVSKCLSKVSLGNNADVPVYTTHKLKKKNTKVTRAVIVIHGNTRNADSYFKNTVKAVAIGCKDRETVIVAPKFLAKYTKKADKPKPDSPSKNQLYWDNNSTWKRGGKSSKKLSLRKSSFAVVDHIVGLLANKKKFPKLQRITIIGHSAGGQFTQRYAGFNRAQPLHSHLKFQYVVSNPSSYTYPNEYRLKKGTQWYKPTKCSKYNDYRYGLNKLGNWGYLKKTGAAKFRENYAKRRVYYLMGKKDTKRDSVFDISCQADEQGPNRYQRGRRMLKFMDKYYSGHRHKLYTAPQGHSGGKMIKSENGVWLLNH